MVLQNINKNQFLLPPSQLFYYYFLISMCFSLPQKRLLFFILIKTGTCQLGALVAHVWQRCDQHCHLLWRLCDGRSTLRRPILQMAASPWLLSQFSHGCVEILQFRAGFAAQAVRGTRLSSRMQQHDHIPQIYLEQMEILRTLPVMDAASDIPTALLALS